MEDNVGIYKYLLFELPDIRVMRIATVIAGIVFGAVTTWLLSPLSSVQANIIGGAVIALFFYVLPAVASGELLARFGGVTGRWTYLMALIDQIAVILFAVTVVVAESVIVDNVQEAWQLLWLGLATVFVINVVMVMGARGRGKLYANLGYAFLFPGSLLVSFHVFIGQLVGIPKVLYLRNSVLFIVSALLLIITLVIYDFLLRANVDDLSSLDFPSAIILGEEQALSGGIDTEVYHQALHIEQDDGDTLRYNIPWVHPGPVEGFGGGRLTEELIDTDTFFLHVPSDHSLDLADPADIDVFRDLPDADMHTEATMMVTVERDGFTIRGRRYGDADTGKYIVYLQNRDLDDYDPGVIRELKNRYSNLCLIDLHNQPLRNANPRMQAIDPRADDLRDAVQAIMQQLEQAETYRYRAGFAGDTDYRCLVEAVDGQEICLLGIDGNDAPAVLYDVESALADRFDKVLVYTTDSHKRLLELAVPRTWDAGTLVDAAETARNELQDAAAGIGETTKQVTVLGEKYSGLIHSLNMMARLVPISLLLYYLGIVLLIM